MMKRHVLCALFMVLISLSASASDEIQRFSQVGKLSVECSEGNETSCKQAEKIDRELRDLKKSERCADPKASNEAMICGFVDGYLAGSE